MHTSVANFGYAIGMAHGVVCKVPNLLNLTFLYGDGTVMHDDHAMVLACCGGALRLRHGDGALRGHTSAMPW